MSHSRLQIRAARLALLRVLASLLVLSFLHPALAAVTLPSATEIVNANSGQCVTVPAPDTQAGTGIVQQSCTGAASQTWTLSPFGAGYHIVSSVSGLCLNGTGAKKPNGVQLIQWPCQGTGSTNDQWTLSTDADGYYHVVLVSSGLCLTINGGSQSSGAQVQQATCQGNTGYGGEFELFLPTAPPNTLQSSWSAVIPLPVTPIAVANLPNGNILMWSAYKPYDYEGDIGSSNGQTYTGIFNPTTQKSTKLLVKSTGADMFCPGTALLPDGKVLINGGSSSSKTTFYDPLDNSWSAGPLMNYPRGYEGDTLLSNGGVLTMGGSWSGNEGGKYGEVWTGAAGWTTLSNVPETNVIGPDPQGVYRGDNHLWLIATSNGNVFHAGPSAQMNWITTAGEGSITSAGDRGTDTFSVNGNAVLYDIGRILKVGGAPAYQQDLSTPTYANANAYAINIGPSPALPVTVQPLPGMSYARAFSNAVVLPDGNVLVVGGQTVPQPFSDTTAVLVPELWNPVTQKFSLLAPMDVPRTYHSTALLLNDGRVFVAGGGQCGPGCPNNHLDAQILTPPYLFTASGALATQARITSAPATAVLGSAMTVSTNVPVASFVLMRLGAATHTTNNDQRRIPVFSARLPTGAYEVLVPADPGIALPGYYFLFALDASGVPSLSVPVQLTLPGGIAPPANDTFCANGNASCKLPAGATATVWYGAGSNWSVIGNLSGSVPCTDAVFTDPDGSVSKTCTYALTPPAAASNSCAVENGTCSLPAKITATVWYGLDTHWTFKTGVSGSIACTDAEFGNPEPNVTKVCAYQVP